MSPVRFEGVASEGNGNISFCLKYLYFDKSTLTPNTLFDLCQELIFITSA